MNQAEMIVDELAVKIAKLEQELAIVKVEYTILKQEYEKLEKKDSEMSSQNLTNFKNKDAEDEINGVVVEQ